MNTTLDLPEDLDKIQMDTAMDFMIHASALGDAADKRHDQCIREWRITEPHRTDMANQMQRSIWRLQDLCLQVSRDIHAISTTGGTVSRDEGGEYLDQELRKGHLCKQMDTWYRSHVALRQYGHDLSRAERDSILGRTEDVVYVTSGRQLRGKLSDMDPEEECLRSSLVLGEIYRQRRQIYRTLLAAPLSAGKELGTAAIALAAELGASLGVVSGVSAIALQYAVQGVQTWQNTALLTRAELDSIQVIKKHLPANRAHVCFCFDYAEIAAEPEDIIQKAVA